MGQYHIIVNDSKKQWLNPSAFGDGVKLLEFGTSGCGVMCAVAVLLAVDNGKGGGDLRCEDPHKLVGSWAGDSIRIVGDYNDNGAYDGKPEEYEDISRRMVRLLCEDGYLRKALFEGTEFERDWDAKLAKGEPRAYDAATLAALEGKPYRDPDLPHSIAEDHLAEQTADPSAPPREADPDDESMFSVEC